MSTLAALLPLMRTQLLTVSGAVVSEETIHTIQGDGRSPRHLEFAIGCTDTTPLAGPQKASVGLPVRHSIKLVTAYQLKPKNRATSLDTAEAWSASLRTAMLATSWTAAAVVVVTYTGTTIAPGPDGWVWFTLAFNVLQTVAIS